MSEELSDGLAGWGAVGQALHWHQYGVLFVLNSGGGEKAGLAHCLSGEFTPSCTGLPSITSVEFAVSETSLEPEGDISFIRSYRLKQTFISLLLTEDVALQHNLHCSPTLHWTL
jgi:hypothetical protein